MVTELPKRHGSHGRLDLGHPAILPGTWRRSVGVSHVPWESTRALAAFSDPGRSVAAMAFGQLGDHPRVEYREDSSAVSFEAQSRGFGTCCLRFVPTLLSTTQDSLPGGRQPFLDGSEYPSDSDGEFQPSVMSWHPLLQGAHGAQSISETGLDSFEKSLRSTR